MLTKLLWFLVDRIWSATLQSVYGMSKVTMVQRERNGFDSAKCSVHFFLFDLAIKEKAKRHSIYSKSSHSANESVEPL